MNNKKLDFRSSSYFPQAIFFAGFLLCFISLLLISAATYTAAITCAVLAVIILTTRHGLEIDLHKNTYKAYVWFLGFENGEAKQFENIEYIFIKKNRISQQLNSRVSSTTVTKDVFDGYLKFSDQEKIHMLTRENKTRLINKLRPVAQCLSITIIDYSTGEPFVVE